MKRSFNTEELVSRWEDVREIENLMGRRTFYTMLGQNDKVWNEYWCGKEQDPCLGFNHGYYKGYDAVNGWFQALHGYIKLQTELVQKAFPEKLAHKAEDEAFNVGNLICRNITTPLIELAADGQTAKGLWYLMGADIGIGPSGPESRHSWGRVGVDFIKENGVWKIWHLVFAEDLNCPTGSSWGVHEEPVPADPRFAVLADYQFPEPNVPAQVHERFHEKRPLTAFPPLPERYGTFAETFSYGV